MFSKDYEARVFEEQKRVFDQLLKLSEQRVLKPEFIKKKNVKKYYDDISDDTLRKYEKLGLKRHEPIEGGNVFYHTKELDRFMLSH